MNASASCLPEAPQSIEELMQRANALAGQTLGELTQQYDALAPKNLLIEKGWVGQFIERVLGATSGSLAQPDFPELGVELKTLPINRQGNPLESTYVSVVPLGEEARVRWEQSVVKAKLARVLWMPIVAERNIPLLERTVCSPLLWQMDPATEAVLQTDFEEAMEKVALGKMDQLNARFGQYLQVRPKAANSRVLTDVIDEKGNAAKSLPRGFYLRSEFTKNLLHQSFC